MLDKIIDIKLTYRCNNDCKYCCQDRKLRTVNSDLTLEGINEIFDKETDVAKVVLTGGEATLVSNLVEIVETISKKSCSNIQLQTNAKKLKDMIYLQKLIRAGISSFGISLHGCNSDMHEAFSGTKGSFEDVIQALENIKKCGKPVALNCVVTRHNVKSLKDIYDYVKENKFASSIQFAFIHITGKATEGISDFVSISEAAQGVKSVLRTIREDENNSIMVYTEAIPLCLMEGFEKNVSELRNHTEVITYDYRERREFSGALSDKFKKKGPNCNTCLFDSFCDGTWSEYPEQNGFDEFIPVKTFRRDY